MRKNWRVTIHSFFHKQRFFFNSASVLLSVALSWIELQMLLRCCLIHLTITVLWSILYLLYLSMSRRRCRIYMIFFHFQPDFHHNHIILLKQICFFSHFLEYLLIIFGWWCGLNKVNKFQIAKVQPHRVLLSFAWFLADFSLALLIKVLLIKKRVMITAYPKDTERRTHFEKYKRVLYWFTRSVPTGWLWETIQNTRGTISNVRLVLRYTGMV